MERDAASCKQERYFETSNEMKSVLIKIGSDGFDHRPGQKVADESFVKARCKPHCGAEMPKITGMKQDPAANHRASCGQARVARHQQWWSRPRPARRPKTSQRLGRERSRPSRTRSTDDQVGRDSSDSPTKQLKRQVLTVQATQHWWIISVELVWQSLLSHATTVSAGI